MKMWKKINSEFYRQLDLKWKENKHSGAFVEMYEKTKLDILERGKELYRWRMNGGEIEIRLLDGNRFLRVFSNKDSFYKLLTVFLIPLALFVNYLYFFASCDLVKKLFYLTYTPGRCL